MTDTDVIKNTSIDSAYECAEPASLTSLSSVPKDSSVPRQTHLHTTRDTYIYSASPLYGRTQQMTLQAKLPRFPGPGRMLTNPDRYDTESTVTEGLNAKEYGITFRPFLFAISKYSTCPSLSCYTCVRVYAKSSRPEHNGSNIRACAPLLSTSDLS